MNTRSLLLQKTNFQGRSKCNRFKIPTSIQKLKFVQIEHEQKLQIMPRDTLESKKPKFQADINGIRDSNLKFKFDLDCSQKIT